MVVLVTSEELQKKKKIIYEEEDSLNQSINHNSVGGAAPGFAGSAGFNIKEGNHLFNL